MPASRETMGTDGIARSTSRLSAAISPSIVPPSLDVDHREPRHVENVAGNDDVRAAEEDDRVAVGVRRGLMQHLDALRR